MKRQIFILSLSIIVLIVIGAIFWCRLERKRHIDIDSQQYPVAGIDVSAHNGNIDFNKVSKSGIDFVFIKATEGGSFKDQRFHSNYNNARKAGLKVGAYHFFKFNTDGDLQALNIIHCLRGKSLDLPLVIDIEEYSNDKDTPTEDVISQLSALIYTLQVYNLPIMLYSNKKGYSRFIKGRFDKYPLWICSFTDPPIDGKWLFWQYSHKGSVKGISGDTDLNTFNGSYTDWELWIDSISLKLQ